MTKDEVKFVGKMIIDEVLELFATVMDSDDAKNTLTDIIKKAKNVERINPDNEHKIIAEQADALVDIWYYSCNAACKKGINLSGVFDIIHSANMAKKDPETNIFLKRSDGKILKPKGWKPPNVLAEIQKQIDQAQCDIDCQTMSAGAQVLFEDRMCCTEQNVLDITDY